jgi:hypothetical protein
MTSQAASSQPLSDLSETEIRALQALIRCSRDALAAASTATAAAWAKTDLAPSTRFIYNNLMQASKQVDLADLEMQAALKMSRSGRPCVRPTSDLRGPAVHTQIDADKETRHAD